MDDLVESWRERAWAQEGPALRSRLEAALAAEPSDRSLRDLAVGALAGRGDVPGGHALSGDAEERAAQRIRWGLAAEVPSVVWDAAHAAALLDLPATGPALVEDLLAAAQAVKRLPPSVRARAYEAYARLAGDEAGPLLEKARSDDPAWTVRRLAGDADRTVARPPTLFERTEALVRCGRLRMEADADPLGAPALAELGLRLPPVYLLFLTSVFPGGRIVEVEDDVKGEEQDGVAVFLTAPAKLEVATSRSADLAGFDEYVWARYVDNARRYPKVDEAYALKRYGDHYGRGRVDAEVFNYGVLSYEAAFTDEAHRDEHLLRCRDLLWHYRDLVKGEAWDVVDDRLEDAEATIVEEGLSWPAADPPRLPVRIGTAGGVAALLLDLESPGVFGRDADEDVGTWLVAPSMGGYLNDPVVHRPGAVVDADPLALLEQVEGFVAAGRKKQAGRLFADVLEQHHKASGVARRAAAIVTRQDVTPLGAAQLLSGVPLPGDAKSLAPVRAVLQEMTPEQALAVVEAAAPYDEEGSATSLLIDAAAGLRKKTHVAAREAAKQVKQVRGKQHIRTLRNPWYR